jgi:FKBP-type peptidyl-prolyl cis-trans isomerase FklB
METTKEKISYCIGLETGRNLKKQFTDVDNALLAKGFHDAIFNAEPLLQKEEMQSLLKVLQQQIEVQQKDYIARIAEENKVAGERFLQANKSKENVIATPSGLQYKVLQLGDGPSPKSTDVVTIHFICSSIDGHVFENTHEQGKPRTFPLNRTIPGWSEALQKMQVGSKWQLFVPSYLAYGEMGYAGIAPNTTLLFELHLLEIKK